MDRRTFVRSIPAVGIAAGSAPAHLFNGPVLPDPEPVVLPKPLKTGGKSVLEALQLRQTVRRISPEELPLQVLSNLLWAAFGVNRERASFNKPGRTAPSASNSQEIDLYVALKDAVYIYEAVPHQLTPVQAGDYRMRSGRGDAG